jgi:hypothetical protein
MSATSKSKTSMTSTSASTGTSPAEIEADARRHQGESMFRPDIMEAEKPNLRRLLNEAAVAADILDKRLTHGLESMAEETRTAAKMCLKRYKDILNDPNQSDEKLEQAVAELKDFSRCKEFGGNGGTLRQFCNAALKGLASSDPLLGLVLAMLFFTIRKIREQSRLNSAQEKLRAYKSDIAKIGGREDPAVIEALKLEIDKAKTRVAKVEKVEKLEEVLKTTLGISDLTSPYSQRRIEEVLAAGDTLTPSPKRQAVNAYKDAVTEMMMEDEKSFKDELIKASGKSPSEVESWMKGSKNPDLDTLVKDAKARNPALDDAIVDYLGLSDRVKLMSPFPPDPSAGLASGAAAGTSDAALADKLRTLRSGVDGATPAGAGAGPGAGPAGGGG